MKPTHCEACDQPFTGPPFVVKSDDGYEVFLCCSEDCQRAMLENAEPAPDAAGAP